MCVCALICLCIHAVVENVLSHHATLVVRRADVIGQLLMLCDLEPARVYGLRKSPLHRIWSNRVSFASPS